MIAEQESREDRAAKWLLMAQKSRPEDFAPMGRSTSPRIGGPELDAAMMAGTLRRRHWLAARLKWLQDYSGALELHGILAKALKGKHPVWTMPEKNYHGILAAAAVIELATGKRPQGQHMADKIGIHRSTWHRSHLYRYETAYRELEDWVFIATTVIWGRR